MITIDADGAPKKQNRRARHLVRCLAFVLPSVLAAGCGISLQEASARGDEVRVAELLKTGADVNAADPKLGPAIVAAALNGQVQTMKVLIQHGANVNATAEGGMTALMAASIYGEVEAVKTLLNSGADVHAKYQTGATALDIAVQQQKSRVVPILLQAEFTHRLAASRSPDPSKATLGQRELDELFVAMEKLLKAKAQNPPAFLLEEMRRLSMADGRLRLSLSEVAGECLQNPERRQKLTIEQSKELVDWLGRRVAGE